MYKGIGVGRGGTRDLNPGLLIPEHNLSASFWMMSLSASAREPQEPLRAVSDSRRWPP